MKIVKILLHCVFPNIFSLPQRSWAIIIEFNILGFVVTGFEEM